MNRRNKNGKHERKRLLGKNSRTTNEMSLINQEIAL
jgi:hypothetical protein